MTLRDVPHTNYAAPINLDLDTLANAIQTVAEHARDADDLMDLLTVLGIEP